MNKKYVLIIILCLCTLSGLFYIWRNTVTSSQTSKVTKLEDTPSVVNGKTRDSDVIAVFSNGPTVAKNQEKQAKPSVAGARTVTTQLSLPGGFTLLSDTTEKNTCDDTQTQTVKEYKKDEIIVTLYENASPTGCDDKTVGDVMVPYVFTDKGQLSVHASEAYTQCTKEQNQTCPKGDGKVTIFVVNSKPSQANKNPVNNKTYAFKIEDSKLDPDFNTQVNKLLDIISSISFSYKE